MDATFSLVCYQTSNRSRTLVISFLKNERLYNWCPEGRKEACLWLDSAHSLNWPVFPQVKVREAACNVTR